MGGIEWGALEVVAEMLGVTDIEVLIVQLCAIRDHQNRMAELERQRS